MAGRYDNTHSRIVATLKVVLPLAALVLLSTVFLVSRRIAPEDALPYADVDVAEMAREQRLTTPRYAGLTDSGQAITVDADSARPKGVGADGVSYDNILADRIVARLDDQDGSHTDLTADAGTMENPTEMLFLKGNVVITTSDGMQMNTDALDVGLASGEAVADQEVRGSAPFGTLQAGAMRLYGETGQQKVDFTRGVHLVYQTRRSGVAAAQDPVTPQTDTPTQTLTEPQTDTQGGASTPGPEAGDKAP